MTTVTSECFKAFKKSIKNNEDIILLEGIDYSVNIAGVITFKGQYHVELKRDWALWVNSWYAAALYFNRLK